MRVLYDVQAASFGDVRSKYEWLDMNVGLGQTKSQK